MMRSPQNYIITTRKPLIINSIIWERSPPTGNPSYAVLIEWLRMIQKTKWSMLYVIPSSTQLSQQCLYFQGLFQSFYSSQLYWTVLSDHHYIDFCFLFIYNCHVLRSICQFWRVASLETNCSFRRAETLLDPDLPAKTRGSRDILDPRIASA